MPPGYFAMYTSEILKCDSLPFQDIAVLVDNTSLCDFYRSESFNMQPRQYCREWYSDTPTIIRPFSEANTQADCEATETGEYRDICL